MEKESAAKMVEAQAAKAQQGGVDVQTILRATADGYELATAKLAYAENIMKDQYEEIERLRKENDVLKGLVRDNAKANEEREGSDSAKAAAPVPETP
jgi:hypothetical protein